MWILSVDHLQEQALGAQSHCPSVQSFHSAQWSQQPIFYEVIMFYRFNTYLKQVANCLC